VSYDANGYVIPNYSSLSGFLTANPGWALPTPQGGGAPIVAMNLLPGIFAGPIATINNIAAGADAKYFFIGWTGAFISLDAAIAGDAFINESPIFTTATGNPLTTPVPGFPVDLKGTFGGMGLVPIIPEPSTCALAGLGLAVLLVFRGRR